jgi:hypothetical protein
VELLADLERTVLHHETKNLVVHFARAMLRKLAAAERKYGYTNDWQKGVWMNECRAKLREHVEKGDPIDVANYCAFLHYHAQSTVTPEPAIKGEEA